MHPLDNAGERLTIVRLNALRALRDELSAYPGVRVSATPQAADLEVEIVNVVGQDDAASILSRDHGHRILVVRMSRNGERLDFVCSDGGGELSAERQAARRIRNWVAGEDFLTLTRRAQGEASLQAIA
jgi:hypothetical protein